MRGSFIEDLSPQGPVIALDQLVDALRSAVTAALSTAAYIGVERVVAELELSFDLVERALTLAAAPLNHPSRQAVGHVRALVWAMLPMELYPCRAHHR